MPKGVYERRNLPDHQRARPVEVQHQMDVDRIFGHLDIGDCWEWTKPLDKDGYGRTHTGSRSAGTKRMVYVHRFVWETLVGPIPSGMQLDHLCRNRKCANPDHLEPVTCAINIRRGQTGKAQSRRTHCPQGHSYDDAFIQPNGGRKCRTCSNKRRREYSRRMKEKAA